MTTTTAAVRNAIHSIQSGNGEIRGLYCVSVLCACCDIFLSPFAAAVLLRYSRYLICFQWNHKKPMVPPTFHRSALAVKRHPMYGGAATGVFRVFLLAAGSNSYSTRTKLHASNKRNGFSPAVNTRYYVSLARQWESAFGTAQIAHNLSGRKCIVLNCAHTKRIANIDRYRILSGAHFAALFLQSAENLSHFA